MGDSTARLESVSHQLQQAALERSAEESGPQLTLQGSAKHIFVLSNAGEDRAQSSELPSC